LWILPVPALAGLALTFPFAPSVRMPAAAASMAFVALLLAVGFGASSHTTFGSPSDLMRNATIGTPRLKVEPIGYAAAARLNRHVPAGAIVLAPERVSLWVPTFHQRAHPLSVRTLYLQVARRHLGADEVRRRRELTLFVQGWRSDSLNADAFRNGLEQYAVSGVCLESKNAEGARPVLVSLGFELREALAACEIWVRKRLEEEVTPTSAHPNGPMRPLP
jgi:hypothetical protein